MGKVILFQINTASHPVRPLLKTFQVINSIKLVVGTYAIRMGDDVFGPNVPGKVVQSVPKWQIILIL